MIRVTIRVVNYSRQSALLAGYTSGQTCVGIKQRLIKQDCRNARVTGIRLTLLLSFIDPSIYNCTADVTARQFAITSARSVCVRLVLLSYLAPRANQITV